MRLKVKQRVCDTVPNQFDDVNKKEVPKKFQKRPWSRPGAVNLDPEVRFTDPFSKGGRFEGGR